MRTLSLYSLILFSSILLLSCEKDDDKPDIPKDPDKAVIVSIDRFSDEAATLMKRSENSLLPDINEPINFDQGDFITQGFGPDGQIVRYYNFDVHPLTSAPIYVLFKEGSIEPVNEQLNIIDVIPGDVGYNDFWRVYEVTVPSDYIANTVTSFKDIIDKGFSINATSTIVNCPVVPMGSAANMRLNNESNTLDRGWYKGKIAYYFTFMEKSINANPSGLIPISPIYVTFNINPDSLDPNSGPPSGIVTEVGLYQTHNVIATIPSDIEYSPLWSVYVYDNADFINVQDLESAEAANILAQNVMYVNCPVVYIEN